MAEEKNTEPGSITIPSKKRKHNTTYSRTDAIREDNDHDGIDKKSVVVVNIESDRKCLVLKIPFQCLTKEEFEYLENHQRGNLEKELEGNPELLRCICALLGEALDYVPVPESLKRVKAWSMDSRNAYGGEKTEDRLWSTLSPGKEVAVVIAYYFYD